MPGDQLNEIAATVTSAPDVHANMLLGIDVVAAAPGATFSRSQAVSPATDLVPFVSQRFPVLYLILTK